MTHNRLFPYALAALMFTGCTLESAPESLPEDNPPDHSGETADTQTEPSDQIHPGNSQNSENTNDTETTDPNAPVENTCTHACETGTSRCSEGNVERCLPDENQCLRWQTQICQENTHCDENTQQCVPNEPATPPESCTNLCQSGSKRCADNAIQTCQANESGCLVWKIETQCGTQTCDETSFTCSSCSNTCTNGTKRCANQNVQECRENSANGCTEWVTIHDCKAENKICSDSNYSCDIPYASPNSIDSFQIMYNQGIRAFELEESDVQYIKAAGFTLVPLSNRADITFDKYNEEMEKAIQLLDRQGINVIVNDYTFQIIRWLSDGWSESSTNPTKDLIVSQIKFYSQFKNVVGFDVRDEPTLEELSGKYNSLVKLITANSPEREIYINLFPCYLYSSDCSDSRYSTYLNQYANAFKNTSAKVLSVDYYPANLTNSSQNQLNEKQIFYNALNTVRTTAQKYNLIPMNISLSTEHNDFKNPLEMREIAWQIAADIAHGMKRISYFTYSTIGDTSFTPTNMEMITRDQKQPTQRYQEVKAINSILGNIGKEIYSKNIKDVTNIDSSCQSTLLSYDASSRLCIYNDSSAVNVVVDVNDSNAIVTTFDDNNTFLLTATGIEKFTDSDFTFRWPSETLQWYDYNSGTYKNVTNGDLDLHNLYRAEIQSTDYGRQIIFHVKAGYALLLRNHD